ncbi:restriction endonuclease subunit S [Apilactobacillus xinyiensis]|uniref:restriction endonuclease subunit S n=1 Tax=Apilactobacillus xinyiensis TaxID=2841032 RepID=UPI003364D59E
MTTSKSARVPRLRFKEFSGEWEKKKLGDISLKSSVKNDDVHFTNILTNSAEFGVIKQSNFFDKVIANSKNIDSYYIVRNNDYIYNPRVSKYAKFGPIKRNKLGEDGIVSPLYYVFTIKNINLNFLDSYFDTSNWYRFMYENGNSGARSDRISIKDSYFQQMPILLPILKEQEKIGNFFTKLDRLIELQTKKVEQLKQLKRGYLQKMFPQKGETLPRLRFVGFSGEWEEKKLGDCLKEFSEKSKVENQHPLFSSTTTKIELRHGKTTGSSNKGYKIVKHNNLILSPQNLWLGNININSLGTGIVSPSYKTFNIVNLNILFCKFFIKNNYMIQQYKLSSTQGASIVRRNLDIDSFYKIKFLCPNPLEQEKIGNFFANLDKKIKLQEKKLSQLQEMKKGYLQKMFC